VLAPEVLARHGRSNNRASPQSLALRQFEDWRDAVQGFAAVLAEEGTMEPHKPPQPAGVD
jgi:hypothetical protein